MSLDPLSNIVAALERDGIIPDIIPPSLGFAPTHLFSILYPTGREVMLGNAFTKPETQDEPLVSFAPMNMTVAEADSTGEGQDGPSYTLAMVDPDVPSRVNPENRSFRHWVVRALISSCVANHAVNVFRVGHRIEAPRGAGQREHDLEFRGAEDPGGHHALLPA